MKRTILFLACMSLTTSVFAAASDQPTTAPTSSSKPLPTTRTVPNVDTVLSEKVQEKIAKLPILKGQSVSAASHEQVVTLEGSVETKAQEEAAIKTAKAVKGVKEVKSQLTIKGSPDK